MTEPRSWDVTMIGWLIRKWHARQRAIDIQILWPACKERASNPENARGAFAVHAYSDPAWLELGSDEIWRQIEELP